MDKYHLTKLPGARPDQRSFHVASTKYVRVEFIRLAPGETLGPVMYSGDVVLTCISGAVDAGDGRLEELEQVVVEEGTELTVSGANDDSVVQVIWSPAHAPSAGP